MSDLRIFQGQNDEGGHRRRRKASRGRRLLHGVYVDTNAEVESELLLRARAAMAVSPAGSAVSHHTAATLFGAVVPHCANIHISSATQWRSRHDGICGHRYRTALDVVPFKGITFTSPGQTIVHLAAELELVDLIVAAESLVNAGRIDAASLVAYIAAYSGRGKAMALRAARMVRPGAESAMETRLRLLLEFAGYPPLKIQHRLTANGRRRRIDLAWAEYRVGVEYDGRQHEEDDHRAADKVRREELGGELWRLVSVTGRELYSDPGAVLDRVDLALDKAGAPPVSRTAGWERHFPSLPNYME
ncbi:MAG: hypothetical protein LWW86_02650 [Micrococcales bacterium]|nr:hypothetical protein [Micrococcales bacterium]